MTGSHSKSAYSYIDISQNNSQSGQLHWDNFQWARAHTAAQPRPINNVKIYGGPANKGYTATGKQAVRRFWRNIIGGSASSRFHRPDSGIGLVAARDEFVIHDLVAYQSPLTQVLSLTLSWDTAERRIQLPSTSRF